jgi:hypothetical protein
MQAAPRRSSRRARLTAVAVGLVLAGLAAWYLLPPLSAGDAIHTAKAHRVPGQGDLTYGELIARATEILGAGPGTWTAYHPEGWRLGDPLWAVKWTPPPGTDIRPPL